jgi:hypothetical protein
MDELDYQVTEDGNKMILTKYLRKPVVEDDNEDRSAARKQ